MAIDKNRTFMADEEDDLELEDDLEYEAQGDQDEEDEPEPVVQKPAAKAASKDSEIEIEVLADPDKPRWRTDPADNLKDDDNEKDFGSKVRKTIGKLKASASELERRRKSAADERDAAVIAAQGHRAENARLKQLLEERNAAGFASDASAADNESNLAVIEYRDAASNGDASAMAKAQARMTAAQVRSENLKGHSEAAKFRATQAKTNADAEAARLEEAKKLAPVAEVAAESVNPKLQSWYKKNSWFQPNGSDEKSAYAVYLHNSAIGQGKAQGSDEYFEAIDDGLRKKYPKFFGVVRGATGGVRSERAPRGEGGEVASQWHNPIQGNKLVFTRGQKAVADQLGLRTNKELLEYARNIVKVQKEKEGRS